MIDFLLWLEGSALGHLMRDTGAWTYPVVNLLHIFGIGTLFGSVLIADLRLLGVWRHVPLAALTSPASRLAQIGCALAIATGVCLFATTASDYAGNPFLLIKFAAIGGALLNAILLYRATAWRARDGRALSPHEERQLAVHGGLSLACWITAVAAGRMIAYW